MDTRTASVRLVGAAYENAGELTDPCVYCGCPASGWDHVPPIHYVSRLTVLDLRQRDLRKYPSCRECNTLLGGVILTTKDERRKLVKSRLKRRYKKWLSMPEWASEELADLNNDSRRYIEGHAAFSKMVRNRIAW